MEKLKGEEREERPGLMLQLKLVGKDSYGLHSADVSAWSNYQK